MYYLSRGEIAPEGSPLEAIYSEYEQWRQDYFGANQLPEFDAIWYHDGCNLDMLRAYMIPYAEHLASADRNAFISRTLATIEAISEELGMQRFALPSPLPK